LAGAGVLAAKRLFFGRPTDIIEASQPGFITGENICIDGGMTKLMIYHNDFGWKLEEG